MAQGCFPPQPPVPGGVLRDMNATDLSLVFIFLLIYFVERYSLGGPGADGAGPFGESYPDRTAPKAQGQCPRGSSQSYLTYSQV